MHLHNTPLQKTQDTLWPSHVPSHIKTWVDRFFQLLDGYTPEAARQWAELYTPDGVFEAFGQSFRGPEAISAHLLRFWAMFPGLLHTPKSIYISRGTHTHPGSAMDIISVTNYAVTFPNGQFVSGESVAVLSVVKEGNRLAIMLNKLILDPNPLMEALAAQSSGAGDKACSSSHHENVAEDILDAQT
ncbi:nuclear transport factor 2 family protein [Aspergillus puulaauensis]|uniref:SnoaL-like domain-containing protein n=1 Tax=Aspergillus puulaauensis TaxID=1220207 RepID=A0A7R7XYC9_9EURO|nr:uncharacterized protein APUU_80310S [Aspergillus puulaauensis]BCS30007.1 hypothetical protein APUU_80310S [Aspergillus puulaauensis]